MFVGDGVMIVGVDAITLLRLASFARVNAADADALP